MDTRDKRRETTRDYNYKESFFLKLKVVKSKNRDRLTDENMTNELRCLTTKLPVDVKKFANYIQKQVSH